MRCSYSLRRMLFCSRSRASCRTSNSRIPLPAMFHLHHGYHVARARIDDFRYQCRLGDVTERDDRHVGKHQVAQFDDLREGRVGHTHGERMRSGRCSLRLFSAASMIRRPDGAHWITCLAKHAVETFRFIFRSSNDKDGQGVAWRQQNYSEILAKSLEFNGYILWMHEPGGYFRLLPASSVRSTLLDAPGISRTNRGTR